MLLFWIFTFLTKTTTEATFGENWASFTQIFGHTDRLKIRLTFETFSVFIYSLLLSVLPPVWPDFGEILQLWHF